MLMLPDFGRSSANAEQEMLAKAAVASTGTIFLPIRRKLPFAYFIVDCPFQIWNAPLDGRLIMTCRTRMSIVQCNALILSMMKGLDKLTSRGWLGFGTAHLTGMMKSTAKRVAIYARVSTDSQSI